MRIERLDLLRYGKFTDQAVQLPAAERDFHLIIGPNEAGKSTLRSAIQDLLFGIETRSRYNFLHPHSEMRLGALIGQADRQLEFIRTKARSKTLQTATGAPLPDAALTPFLGPVDRAFFDQMFGLNHERLVSGGQEILSASNDIGQILFQAAAGIGSLGDLRDRLEAEANTLWAKRKSSDREYYIASAELEQAEATLKQATVRTKDWQQAHTEVDQLGAALRQARARYQALEQERLALERLRRVAPLLSTLAGPERQLAELGAVVALPENAAEQLAEAEHEVAIASQARLLFEQQAAELQAQMTPLHPVQAILARSADIETLSGLRQQLRNVAGDIDKREGEVQVLWQTLEEALRQLGWPAQGEEALGQRLPGRLIRTTLDHLLRQHEALAQALVAAQQALMGREEEVKAVQAEMAATPLAAIPVTLAAALAAARALGDVLAQEKRGAAQLARLARELDAMAFELGAWHPGVAGLRQLLPPTQDETQALIQQRADLALACVAMDGRLADARAEIQLLQLEITHYKAAHQPVTLADVQAVRGTRDANWHAIKSGALALLQAAPGFEQALAQADRLSDQRHDKAQQETGLQSRLDRLQRLQSQVAELETRGQEQAQALSRLDQAWQTQAAALGLAGLPLLRANDWRAARERVLAAANALAEAQTAHEEGTMAVAQARAALGHALLTIQPEVQHLPLPALLQLADEYLSSASRAQERRSALVSQKIRAEAAIPDLTQRLRQAQSALDVWQLELKKNLTLAHLPLDTHAGAIEAALALFERMHQQLEKIRDIRVNRIDLMRRDLQGFAAAARALASALAPEMALEPPAQIALVLDSRLKQEQTAAQELARLQAEVAKASAQAQAASHRIAQATAGLTPLMQLSGATDHDGLRAAAVRSDRQRRLTADIEQAQTQLLQAGDGLARAALEAALAASDVNAIAVRLPEIKQEIDDVVGLQNRLSGELTAAEARLGKIAGQDQAARAESQRQEALARMANAVERYLKVSTAAQLLRWSIERFRESKQGPMLARASEVFCGLTQCAFSRLVVDFESEPLKLFGQRAAGGLVEIDGMSEGTRDQLYLALRLAALELHLAQTEPLPFIADDLFINYDDGRAQAGLQALAHLSEMTQVIFLSHHAHLVPLAQAVLGERLNVVRLG
jgi:uncharacterized protein YhaN